MHGRRRFKSAFVEQCGALRSVRAMEIRGENKHYLWGTTRGDDTLEGRLQASEPGNDLSFYFLNTFLSV